MDFIFTLNPPELDPDVGTEDGNNDNDEINNDQDDNEAMKTPKVEIGQNVQNEIDNLDLVKKLELNVDGRRRENVFETTSSKNVFKTSKSFDEMSSDSSIVHFDVFDDDDSSLTSFENDAFNFSSFGRPTSGSIPFHRSASMPFNRTLTCSEPISLQVFYVQISSLVGPVFSKFMCN